MAKRKNDPLRSHLRRKLGLDRREAVMGDATGLIFAPGRAGHVKVRYITATGDGWPQTVRKPRLPTPYTPGTPVWVGYDEDEQLAVLGPRISAQLAAGENPFGNDVINDPSGGFLDMARVAMLRCEPTPEPSMSVMMHAWMYVVDGDVKLYEGNGDIDLTSFVPTNPGEICLAGVFLDTDTNTEEVLASTPVLATEDLGLADVQEIVTAAAATSMPSKFWRLENGMTEVTEEHDFLDARQWLNVPAMGGSSFTGDAFDVPYTPTTGGDWDGPPTEVGSALDELADRVTTVEAGGSFTLDASVELTIASGAVTVGATNHYRIDTESDDPSDLLHTISGAVENKIYALRCENTGRSVLIQHFNGAGNIYVMQRKDLTLSDTEQIVFFVRIGSNIFTFSGDPNAVQPTDFLNEVAVTGESGAGGSATLSPTGGSMDFAGSSGIDIAVTEPLSGVPRVTVNLDINEITTEAGIVPGDFIPFYDVSAGAIRKVDVDDLPSGGFDPDVAITFNDSGNDADYRFESNNDANNLFSDGGADRVGIGTGTPTAKLNVEGDVIINDNSADVDVRIESNGDANNFFSDGGSDNVGFGTGTPDASAKLHVVSTAKGSIPVPAMTAAQMAAIGSPVEALMAYATDTDMLHLYDAQRFRNVLSIGWQPYAFPINFVGSVAFTSAATLAANGGSIAIPIPVTGHMILESVSVRNTDAATQRTWAWDLYVQYLNNGNSGENTLTRVVASNGSETFTPGAASIRTLAASADTYIGPGLYWLVVQSRHATSNFGLGSTASTAAFALNIAQTKTTTNPNGATLDFVAATWTKVTAIYGVRLNGVVFGQTAAF